MLTSLWNVQEKRILKHIRSACPTAVTSSTLLGQEAVTGVVGVWPHDTSPWKECIEKSPGGLSVFSTKVCVHSTPHLDDHVTNSIWQHHHTARIICVAWWEEWVLNPLVVGHLCGHFITFHHSRKSKRSLSHPYPRPDQQWP